MKFARYLLLTIIVILKIAVGVFSKKAHKQPSQATRNYRKTHGEMSYNPLPQNYHTGPRGSFAMHTSNKYREANARLSTSHNYQDTTRVVANRVNNMH